MRNDLAILQPINFANATVDGENNVAERFSAPERYIAGDSTRLQNPDRSSFKDQADSVDIWWVGRDANIK